jgi:sterol desaturase/sphingolipid hydroxylase (fatty acid hydroxylase superfamily)
MNLIALAAPFFLLAVLLELIINRASHRGLFRANDAINSISLGILYVTSAYFTKLIPLLVWGFVLQNFALVDMPLAWFDTSLRGIALWITAILAWDFCYYWFHRYSHEISVLWAAHAVHHQSEDYNLSTALRQTSSSFLFSWIFYLPLFLIGFPLEVLIAASAVNLIYQFWVHTQLVRRLGVLDYVLVTPSNHRVHHAQNESYIDRNYGGILIVWDRLFGTFADERDEEPIVFGVRKPLANWNPFWANLQVYDYLLFDARKAARWRDKLSIWFRHTGWRPADVAARYPKKPSDLSHFVKYDPPVSTPLRRYVLAQFLVALAATLVIGEMFVSSGARGVLIPCLMLWAQLYGLGLVNEGRPYALRLELFRLLFVTPAGFIGLQLIPTPGIGLGNLWGGVLAYVTLSLVGLFYATQNIRKNNSKYYIKQ